MNKTTKYIVVDSYESEIKECKSLDEVNEFIKGMLKEGNLSEEEITELIRVFEVTREANVSIKTTVSVE